MDKKRDRSLSKENLDALLEDYMELCMRRANLAVEQIQVEQKLAEAKRGIAELYEELGE